MARRTPGTTRREKGPSCTVENQSSDDPLGQTRRPNNTTHPLTIRPASPTDTDAVTRIYITSWNAGFGPLLDSPNRRVTPDLITQWRSALARTPPHRWWVAGDDGEITGFVGIRPSRDPVDPRLGELDTIAVAPEHWRRGIGRKLATVAHAHLVEDGYDAAILWTVTGYAQGLRFYDSLGWKPDDGARDNGRQIRLRLELIAR